MEEAEEETLSISDMREKYGRLAVVNRTEGSFIVSVKPNFTDEDMDSQFGVAAWYWYNLEDL